MRLFSKMKDIYSPTKGSLIAIQDVNDESFSNELIGTGIAIVPESDLFYAPIDGVVAVITPTKHAIAIQAEDGVQVLIHVGIDSYDKCLDCFKLKVTAGQAVKKGELIAEIDIDKLKASGIDVTTPIIILNKDKCKDIVMSKNAVVHKGDWIIRYKT